MKRLRGTGFIRNSDWFYIGKEKTHQISQLLCGKMGTAQRIIYQLHIPLQERSHLGSHWQDYAEG